MEWVGDTLPLPVLVEEPVDVGAAGRPAACPAQTIARARPPGLHVFPTFVLRELAVLLALTLLVVAMKVGPLLASPPCLCFHLSHHVPPFLPVCTPRPAQPGSRGFLDRDGPSSQSLC